MPESTRWGPRPGGLGTTPRMKIACIGGGPAGLYFALLMKQQDAEHDITVIERQPRGDTSGWGVVFSDAAMDALRQCDGGTAARIGQALHRWDDIALRFKGRTLRSGGHGFAGIGRARLLDILRARCEHLGVRLVFGTEASDADYPDADLVVASDGVHSGVRARHADVFQPVTATRPNRYLWLGTRARHDAFTFDFRETAHGWFQAHIYPFDAQASACIVECPEPVWRAHGLDRADTAQSIAFCEALFAGSLQGHGLLAPAQGAAWRGFQHVACAQWWLRRAHGGHVALMGDAAHTAHFAIGSGTRLAMEDAVELARQLQQPGGTVAQALAAYQQARQTAMRRLRNAAWNAMEWFESCGQRYCGPLAPEQFLYSLLTRSQRIGHENLRLRDRAWLEGYERWFARRADVPVAEGERAPPPMFTPLRVRGVTLKNRIAVSPMAQYSAVDGFVGDYHLVHLGARALGGAGLVLAEMTAVSAQGRITPGCPGLYAPGHAAAWKRIADWVHAHTDAKFGLQIGHAGAKGSTRPAWEGMDLPLERGNWPLLSASPLPYLEGTGQVPREMARADMDAVTAQFAAAARAAAEAGADWLELHCAHGYLLSSFLSPLTNRRTDAYGGPLHHRLRYPLEVLRAVRAAWPAARPLSVRISAHDWVEGGTTPDDAVEIARAFKAAGADMIACSSGQVSPREQPAYGRMYQVPFADRIRQEAGIPTIAVGGIREADHANSILAAGRADLCAVGRPHLANPAWTLTEAARIGYTPIAWPRQYRAGQAPHTSLRTTAP